MPSIWMDVDVALAEVPVNILPLIDDTDFKSRETGIVYDQAGMDLVWNFVTRAGAMTQTAVTPTTGGDYDWAHQGDGMYSIEIPASGGASINNTEEGFGWFIGFCTGVLPWRSPIIGFRAAGLNTLLVESAYSATRGLAGTALPDAAANAAGGLPISAAGGLAMDGLPSATADDVWDEARADHEAAGSFGRFAHLIRDGTAQAGAARSIILDAGASAVTNLYIDAIVCIIGGTGAGQSRRIKGYVGGTKVVSVQEAWATNPDDTSVFIIIPRGKVAAESVPFTLISTTIATLASQTSFTLTEGSADDDAYNDLCCVIRDSATAEQQCAVHVLDYVGASKTITLIGDPGVFAMAAGDTVDILAQATHRAEIADAVWEEDVVAAHNAGDTAGALIDDLGTPADFKADVGGLATAAALATAQADLDAPDQYKADVSALATAANQTTILNRIGAITGAGVNTILGFFKALLNKAAGTPSDIGGTFTPAADSTEAISEAVATIDVSGVADQVWNEATADHQAAGSAGKALTDAQAAGDPWASALPGAYGAGTAGSIIGTLIASMWSNVTRTLTQTAAQVQAVLEGSRITIHRGDDLAVSLTGLGNLVSRTHLWFTVKRDKSDIDTAAIIQITEGEGLTRLNGAEGTVGNGSLTVDDEDAGNITLVLKAVETAKLRRANLHYDVQVLISGVISTRTESRCNIAMDVTRATSAE